MSPMVNLPAIERGRSEWIRCTISLAPVSQKAATYHSINSSHSSFENMLPLSTTLFIRSVHEREKHVNLFTMTSGVISCSSSSSVRVQMTVRWGWLLGEKETVRWDSGLVPTFNRTKQALKVKPYCGCFPFFGWWWWWWFWVCVVAVVIIDIAFLLLPTTMIIIIIIMIVVRIVL